MPTATPDPPETGGVEAMRTETGRPSRSVGTVARKAQRKRVLEEARRLGENRIRKWFRAYRQGKSVAFALRRRLRENWKKVSFRDETRSKPNEADHPETGRGVVRRLRHVKSNDSYLEKPAQPIANVGEVPLSHVGHKGKLLNVLHVPTITKNLVSVGQIVDQGMECWKWTRPPDQIHFRRGDLLLIGFRQLLPKFEGCLTRLHCEVH